MARSPGGSRPKKKERKNISSGVAHVLATFNAGATFSNVFLSWRVREWRPTQACLLDPHLKARESPSWYRVPSWRYHIMARESPPSTHRSTDILGMPLGMPGSLGEYPAVTAYRQAISYMCRVRLESSKAVFEGPVPLGSRIGFARYPASYLQLTCVCSPTRPQSRNFKVYCKVAHSQSQSNHPSHRGGNQHRLSDRYPVYWTSMQ